MDDPQFLQFFTDPLLPQQRRYEAIRAVIIEGQPLPAAAARFGFAYGTLRNLVAQFRSCIRQGRTPPFSLRPHTGDPRANQRTLVPMLISLSEGAKISGGAGHGERYRIPLAAHVVVEEGGLS
jgi:hypothetical protein